MDFHVKLEQAYAMERMGSLGVFACDIRVGTTRPVNLDAEGIREALYAAMSSIEAAVMEEIVVNDPEDRAAAAAERNALLGVFKTAIFVEAIPCGYHKGAYNKTHPWFKVTTSIGHFVIGWRGRVIQIEWSGTVGTESAEVLFPNEPVTKDGRMIHAYSYQDAARYVAQVIATAKAPTP